MRQRRAAITAVLALATLGALAAQGAAQTTQRLFLVRGADAVKGLPFFPPNAIHALVGAYGVGGGGAAAKATETKVWYTREALVLGTMWKRADFPGYDAFVLTRPQGSVMVFKTSAFHLFFEASTGTTTSDPGLRAFVRAFIRKFTVFFENVATDAELSFPAFVDQ